MLHNHVERFLNYFCSPILHLLQSILAITTLTFIESLSSLTYLVSMD